MKSKTIIIIIVLVFSSVVYCLSNKADKPLIEDNFITGDEIPWETAVEFIGQCKVEKIMQLHSLDVYLTLKDERELKTKEPRIDEVFEICENAEPVCGDILLGTE